ncbi:hypothetical protein RB200_07065 [Streptomyces sp. PmtG]
MDTTLTISVMLALIMGVAYVMQRFNAQLAGQMAPPRSGRFLPGGRGARGSAARPVRACPGHPPFPNAATIATGAADGCALGAGSSGRAHDAEPERNRHQRPSQGA